MVSPGPGPVRDRGDVRRGADPSVQRQPVRRSRRRRRARRRDRRDRNAAAHGGSHGSARRADRRRDRTRPGQDYRRRAVLGRQHRPPDHVPAQLHPAGLPVSRDRDGCAQGGMARTGTAGRALPRHRPAEALSDSRHQRDHRRPHRRHLRDRLHGRHARHSAVRAEGAAARRRLLGFAEAQSRPARSRHPPEDSEDVREST